MYSIKAVTDQIDFFFYVVRRGYANAQDYFCFALNPPVVPVSAQAVVYNVNRSFASITNNTATLTGTLTAPLGNYVIQNQGASPFTNVNLLLTVNATPYNLVTVDTSLIKGTGQSSHQCDCYFLDVQHCQCKWPNPADLSFWDVILIGDAKYAIGSDADPRFEVAETSAGKVLAFTPPTFPVLFGTAVPEPFYSLAARHRCDQSARLQKSKVARLVR